MRKNLKYILILGVGFVALMLMEWLKPKPLDWSLSFSKRDKIPYGGFVLHKLLPEIFPGQRLVTTNLPIYNILRSDSTGVANYLFINVFFSPDELDTRELLAFVARGSHVFIAANGFASVFADTLLLATNLHFVTTDSVSINFVNPALRAPEYYRYKMKTITHYFSRFDTARTTVLGIDDRGQANFIKTTFGEGAFFLSTVPMAFVNYHLLVRHNVEYACKALSYLPLRVTRWDEHYKAGRHELRTPLRYVLSNEALRWAYFVGLAGLVLFIVFAGRRRQRLIPVIPPKTNTTLEFVETVGRLYYQHGDHKNIADKKIGHFLDYIRTHFYLKTTQFDGDFCEKLAKKSGIDVQEIGKLFELIERTRLQAEISEAELIALNKMIERFYQLTRV